MPGVSLPVSRPSGQAIVIATAACQAQPVSVLSRLGFEVSPLLDPYSSLLELCRRPGVFRAVIISLHSVYREELQVIATIKRRFPQVEVWLTQTDGRHAALAEGMRLGADGLLDEEGLHRTAAPVVAPDASAAQRPAGATEAPIPLASPQAPVPASSASPPPLNAGPPAAMGQPVEPSMDADSSDEAVSIGDDGAGEPVLTADELRALLQEQPSMPPSSEN